MATIHVSDSALDTAAEVAQWLMQIASHVDEPFSIALAGGSTPRLLYQIMARSPYLETFPWHRTHWFFGDERVVPLNHPDSNFRMVKEALFDHVPVSDDTIYPFDTSLASESDVAGNYEASLKRFAASGRPLFDVVLLGVGEDGHTASLFPGIPTLTEPSRWTTCTPVGVRKEPRVSLTFNAIASSRHVAFLVCGHGKREIVASIFDGGDCPAARVRSEGEIHWFMDKDAYAV